MAQWYRTGELARLYHIDPDTLRYYEEQNLLHPRRAPNGYRMFGPRDVWQLNTIRKLRSLGMSLARIRLYFEAPSAESFLDRIDEELALLYSRQNQLQQAIQSLTHRRQALEDALHRPVGQVQQLELKPRRAHIFPPGHHGSEKEDPVFQNLPEPDPDGLWNWGSAAAGVLLDLTAVKQGSRRKHENIFVLHPNGEFEIEGGTYLCLCHRDPSGQNSSLQKLLAAAEQGSWYPAGPMIELWHTDIFPGDEPENHLAEFQLRVVPDARFGTSGMDRV